MINGYDINGQLVYSFNYYDEVAEYFGLEFVDVHKAFVDNRQLDCNGYIFHNENSKENCFNSFIRMFNKVLEDNTYLDKNKAGYEINTNGGVISINYGDARETFNEFEKPKKFSAITTAEISNLLGTLEFCEDEYLCDIDPKFVDGFGYPHIDSCSTSTMDLTEAKDYFCARNKKIVEMVEGGCDHDIDINIPVQSKEDVNILGGKDGGNYDDKGNSAHYQMHFMEYVREQERKYGTIVAYLVCLGNVDKYAQRAGMKEGVPADKDLTKRSWYFKAAQYFKSKIEAYKECDESIDNRYVELAEEVVDLFRVERYRLDDPNYKPLSEIVK